MGKAWVLIDESLAAVWTACGFHHSFHMFGLWSNRAVLTFASIQLYSYSICYDRGCPRGKETFLRIGKKDRKSIKTYKYLQTKYFLTDCRFWHRLLQLPPGEAQYICCLNVLKMISAFAGAPRWKDSAGERKKSIRFPRMKSAAARQCVRVCSFLNKNAFKVNSNCPLDGVLIITQLWENFQLPNCWERYMKSLTFLSVINYSAPVADLLQSAFYSSALKLVHLRLISLFPSLTKEPLQTICIQSPVDVTRHLCNQIHARLVPRSWYSRKPSEGINLRAERKKKSEYDWSDQTDRPVDANISIYQTLLELLLWPFEANGSAPLMIQLQPEYNQELQRWWLLMAVCDLCARSFGSKEMSWAVKTIKDCTL